MGKLVQIKEFNEETITHSIAAELCAVGGGWHHYTEKEFKSKGFEVINQYSGEAIKGTSRLMAGNESEEYYIAQGYNRVPAGIRLAPKCGTSHVLRIWKDGSLMCNNIHEKGELKSVTDGKAEYYEKRDRNLEFPANQINYVQKLIDLGFYEYKE